MDNQEAELKVAQEVPFITGQFTNTAASTGGVTGGINPFQTIQRQEVGTILKVTPTISAEGNSVMLKISIESSSIGQKPAGAVDLVTNKRTITTTVLIEDGGVVVLGGLIEDNSVKGEQRVRTRQHPAHRPAVQDTQRVLDQEQPHPVHPPEDPARPVAGGV